MTYLFMLAVCITAASSLTFLLEPIAGRLLLPVLGGSPAVWSGCLVFFQCALLAGYSVAHVLGCSLRRTGLLLFVGALLASFAPLRGFGPPRPPADISAMPMLWLLGWLSATIGPAFAALCAVSPLLQAALSRSPHPRADDPYFLYAASNIGSFAALIAYPLLVEPYIGLTEQIEIWRSAYVVFSLLLGVTLIGMPLKKLPEMECRKLVLRPRWIALAAVPSSLTVGVTAYLSSDVSPIPLFWIVPLAIYLLTFVVAFGPARERALSLCERIYPFAILAASPLFFFAMRDGLLAQISVHLWLFFLASCLCHTRLASERPHPSLLGGFYLSIAIGGALGGIFNSLVAPHLFTWLAEYPIAYVAALYALPSDGRKEIGKDLAYPFLLFALITAMMIFVMPEIESDSLGLLAVFGPAALLCIGFKHRPLRLALALLALLPPLRELAAHSDASMLFAGRNFFGTKEVRVDDHGYVSMVHGHVIHGMQQREPARRLETFAYYGADGPAGDIFQAAGQSEPVAVVGLGVGSLACLGGAEQEITFFEIDELVVSLARDARFFTFLRDCPSISRVELADGRLGLASEPNGSFGLVLLDAFSSDAIPVHLLTEEALEMYTGKLRPGGLLAFHVSNNFLDLEPVIGNTAKRLGLIAKHRHAPGDEKKGQFPSDYVVVAKEEADLARLGHLGDWKPARTDDSLEPWTDERADILSVMSF